MPLVGGEQINRRWTTLGLGAIGLVIAVSGVAYLLRPAFRVEHPVTGGVSFEVLNRGTVYMSGALAINLGGVNGTGAVAKTGVALEVFNGAMSGANIVASKSLTGSLIHAGLRLSGAGLSDCDGGTAKLLWDSATKRFSCGTDQNGGFSTGNVLTIGDARYLKLAGGTLTGALRVQASISGSSLRVDNLKNCNTIDTDANGVLACGTDADTTYITGQGLSLNGTSIRLNATVTGSLLSGTSLVVSRSATISGALLVKGTLATKGTLSGNALNIMAGNSYLIGAVSIGKTSAVNGAKLDVLGILSGSNLTISRSASLSGTLLVKTSITSKGSVSGSTLVGFGLGSCSNATSSKLLYSNSTNQFTCGTDQSVTAPVSVNTGGVLQLGDARYLRKAGGTVTGLTIFDLKNAAGDLTSGLVLKWLETASGNILHAEKDLTSSGTLTVLNRSFFRNTLSGSNLHAERAVSASGSIVSEGTISGSIVRFTTASGHTIRANVIARRYSGPAQVFASGTTVTTSSGTQVVFGPFPPEMSGFNLTGFQATVDQNGVTGLLRMCLRNTQKGKRQIFSTCPSIDSNERSAATAATAYVIDQAKDDISGDDTLTLDILQVHTTAPKGLHITLQFDKP